MPPNASPTSPPLLRTLGLIGGCSAVSTAIYYSRINDLVRARRPGHGARLLLWSFDVEDIDACCRAGDWTAALDRFEEAGRWLEGGGAEAIVICTNTMHLIADPLAERLGSPLIHIIDETAAALRRDGRRRPILLGTRFTMQEPFYRERLRVHGLDARLPSLAQQDQVHSLIYDELMAGEVSEHGRRMLAGVIEALAAEGADSVILACTELGLSIRAQDVSVAVYDTAEIHCQAAAAVALRERNLGP